MRKLLLLLAVTTLLPLTTVFSQTLEDYILEHRGDALVIKDDIDFGAPNTLFSVINADTLNVPAGRVYILKAFGNYSLANNPTTSATRKTIIMGETTESVKTSKGDAPPVVSGAVLEGGNTTPFITSGSDLLVKNINMAVGNAAGGLGWNCFGLAGPGMRIQVENCIIEHNLWTVIGGQPANSRIFFINNYFVNLLGHTCRRNGGVLDFFSNQDTIWVENNTHVNVQGLLYKSRDNYVINRQVFNHNNFINCSSYPLMNRGGHPNYSVTNNIFVNTNVQGFSSVLISADAGEVDPEGLPMGIVNLHADSTFLANGASFYADRNLTYWDPSLSDIATTLNNNAVNGKTDWVSQMIPMNTRTAAMFADDATYPKLTNGTWYSKLPNFAETDVLFTTQLQVLKEFSIATVDTTFSGSLAAWRQPNNPEADNFIYADWPTPIDLSYDDADLLTAGLGGFPVGDLAWFPAKYSEWMNQRDAEYTLIHNTLNGIVGVEKVEGLPAKFSLEQNYPNPFNPTTEINFSIPKSGNVTLKIFDAVGQEVATLINEFKPAANYKINFNASNLTTGVYFYRLEANNLLQTKKMLLIK